MLKYRKLQGIQKYLGKISVQCSAVTQLCLTVTPWTAGHQASLSITNSWSSLKLVSIESVRPSKHLILCIGSQSIGVSAPAPVLSMNIQDWFPFKMDWVDLLAVQGTLKNLLQHHNSKVSTLWCSASFLIQLSHPYMTTDKNYSLD